MPAPALAPAPGCSSRHPDWDGTSERGGGVAACCRPIGLCPRAAARPGGGGARKRMRPHTDAGFGAISDERGAYLPAERPSAASSAARLAATQQQRCRASTAPASQRVSPTPTLTRTSRRDRGRTAAESPTCVPLFFFPTHPACAGEFLGCAAASMSSATHAQRRLSTSNGGPSRPGEASPAGSSCTRASTAATAARASTAAAAAAAAAAATAATGCLTTGGEGRLTVRAACPRPTGPTPRRRLLQGI